MRRSLWPCAKHVAWYWLVLQSLTFKALTDASVGRTLCCPHQSTLACGHRLVLHDVLLGRPWAHHVLVPPEVLFRRHWGLCRVLINESVVDGQSQGQARIKVAGKMVHQGVGPVVCKLLWGELMIYFGKLPSPRSFTGTVIQQRKYTI